MSTRQKEPRYGYLVVATDRSTLWFRKELKISALRLAVELKNDGILEHISTGWENCEEDEILYPNKTMESELANAGLKAKRLSERHCGPCYVYALCYNNAPLYYGTTFEADYSNTPASREWSRVRVQTWLNGEPYVQAS